MKGRPARTQVRRSRPGSRRQGTAAHAHGTLVRSGRGTNFVIQPIEDDPRFHVIYEEDNAKVVRGTHALDEAEQPKLQRHRQFQEQLDEERRAHEAGKQ